VVAPDLLILADTDVDAIIEAARRSRAGVLLVDSIQAVRCPELGSVPGSVAQVRESAARLVAFAKATGIPVVLVGHATKDGSLAGPRALEHVVDTVIQFDGDRHHAHRILRALKNRFGPSDEIGVFTMNDTGLTGIGHPSAIFLAERAVGEPGSAVLAAIEGSRPLLVEVQALVGDTAFGSPRRTALGVDGGRVALILAVLARRAGMDVAGRDVFVNVAGGLDIAEPAADLAVALAAASSFAAAPIPERWAILGEIGLAGEVRNVSRIEARLREAARMGFETALAPPRAAGLDTSGLRASCPSGMWERLSPPRESPEVIKAHAHSLGGARHRRVARRGGVGSAPARSGRRDRRNRGDRAGGRSVDRRLEPPPAGNGPETPSARAALVDTLGADRRPPPRPGRDRISRSGAARSRVRPPRVCNTSPMPRTRSGAAGAGAALETS
jgi:hypothetical protein